MANNGKKKTSTEISNNILDALEILTNSSIQSAQFDKTITGIIVSCEDETIGKYKVQYQDAIFIAYSSSLDVKYSKGTSVQVKIPNNDFNGRKMIIGTVEEGGIDFGDVVEDPLLRYEVIGTNCIGSSVVNELSSYWTAETNSRILFDKDNGINLIALNEQMFEDNLRLGNSVLLGATIRTLIPEEQRFKGDYGIIYTFTFNNPAVADNTVDKYYIVNIDKMTGDPYSYNYGSEQVIPFDIDKENFLYVKKIELFAYDFINIDSSKPADIFISNIRLQAARRLDTEEFDTTALTIVQPQGNYFSSSEGITSKTAVAQLRIQGKITNSSAIEYYWFEEDLTITKTDNLYYSKYGGRGWKCLNQFNVLSGTDVNPTAIQFVNAGNTFTFNQNDSKARERRYKCVAVYRDIILFCEFSFINYDILNGATITCDRGYTFTDNIGATTLTCNAENAVSYIWATVDGDQTFTTVNETTADNNRYNNAASKYIELYNQILNGEKPDSAANQALLKSYQDTMDEFDVKMRVDANQVINLQASSIFGLITYKCQAFDSNGDSLGIATQLLTNTLKAQNDEQTGSLVIHNGNQVFRYDAKGIAPTSDQFENPQVIQPLSFTLRTAGGIEIPQTAIRDTDVTWIVPINESMIRSYTGTLVSEDEEKGIAVYNGKNLSYTINENYYARRDNNEIELQVMYMGVLYTTKTNFIFVKDGDTGTNGTDLVVRLIPETTMNGRIQIMDSNVTTNGSGWFTVELWRNGLKIYTGVCDGTSTEGKTVNIVWSAVGTRNTGHSFSIQSNGVNSPVWTPGSYSSDNVDIAKATVTYNGVKVVATAPVAYMEARTGYRISLKKNTGYTHVVYSSDGKDPSYDNHLPFEVLVEKQVEGIWTDVTDKEGLSFNWDIIGNLREKNATDGIISGGILGGLSFGPKTCDVIPNENYDEAVLNNALVCTAWKYETNGGIYGAQTYARIHIPIHFMLNAYGHSAINGWDGNTIELSADGGTMLLAPQAGFGDKNADNSFNGVLLGKVSTDGTISRGLMGYYQGERTIFLNSDDGSATFGKSGAGQIIFDPTDGTAIIKSGNYVWDPDNGTGMQINLTEPGIYFGSQNFYVTEEGILHAAHGEFSGKITATDGTIGGWDIDEYSINHNRAAFDTRSSQGTHIGTAGISIGRTYISPDGTIKSYYSTSGSRRTEISNTGFSTINTNGITTCRIDDNEFYFSVDKTINDVHTGRQVFRIYSTTTSSYMSFYNPDTNRTALTVSPSGMTFYRSTDRTDGMSSQYLFRIVAASASSDGGMYLYDYDSYDRLLMKVAAGGIYSYNSSTGNISFSVTDTYGLRVFHSNGNTAMKANANGMFLYNSNGSNLLDVDSNGLWLYNSSGSVSLKVEAGGLFLYNPSTQQLKLQVNADGLYVASGESTNKPRFRVTSSGIDLYNSSGERMIFLGTGGVWSGTSYTGINLNISDTSKKYISFGKYSSSSDSYITSFLINHGLNPYNSDKDYNADTAEVICFDNLSMHGDLRFRTWEPADSSKWDYQSVWLEGGYWTDTGKMIKSNCPMMVGGDFYSFGEISCSGEKHRVMSTEHFGTVALSAYETPVPFFGDIGQGQCNEDGYCYVYLDEIFKEVTKSDMLYYVFLQGIAGNVELYQQEDDYFIVKGAPQQKFNFEIKSKQNNADDIRFRRMETAQEQNLEIGQERS